MVIPLVLCSGMPRSGSTLLQNLLAQCPRHHCTATNDLLDLLCVVRDKWMTCPGFIAQGLREIEPRVVGLLRGAVVSAVIGGLIGLYLLFQIKREYR